MPSSLRCGRLPARALHRPPGPQARCLAVVGFRLSRVLLGASFIKSAPCDMNRFGRENLHGTVGAEASGSSVEAVGPRKVRGSSMYLKISHASDIGTDCRRESGCPPSLNPTMDWKPADIPYPQEHKPEVGLETEAASHLSLFRCVCLCLHTLRILKSLHRHSKGFSFCWCLKLYAKLAQRPKQQLQDLSPHLRKQTLQTQLELHCGRVPRKRYES